jgi:D-glycero-alpha-D-manno-heptose-7-phosphate kinase
MKECIMTGDFEGIINSLKSGWESKKTSASSVTNKLVEDIHCEAIKAGALAGRLSGAGGGGFMLFYVPAQKRVNVINALKKFDGYSCNCHFTFHGAQSWRVFK